MSVDTLKSTRLATPRPRVLAIDSYGKIRFEWFDVAAPAVAGDDGSMVDLFYLPAGRVRVLPHLSKIWGGVFGASRVLQFGHRAYKKSDGVTSEAEALNAFGSALDVSGATVGLAIGTGMKYDIFSHEGVLVSAKVTGGTWPITTATLKGYLAIIVE